MTTVNGGRPRVLCVDDVPEVLDALRDTLRRHFDVVCSTNGFEALKVLVTEPVAVVLSDMRMPNLDGARFLALARERSPDTVRMLLTGESSLTDAVAAVNDGQIFRFLLKPCPADILIPALTAGVEQHRLITAEKVLLGETLRGAVWALMEVLALADPQAFGRAHRLKQLATDLARSAGIRDVWEIEIAAMLHHVGLVSLPGDSTARLASGLPLRPDEQRRVDELPRVAQRLIQHIPRFEPVQAILAHQATPDHDGAEDVPIGARILRVAVDFDLLEVRRVDGEVALASMRTRGRRYDRALLDALAAHVGATTERQARVVRLDQLELGMTFAEHVVTSSGAILVQRDAPVTRALLESAPRLRQHGAVEPVRVWLPPEGEEYV